MIGQSQVSQKYSYHGDTSTTAQDSYPRRLKVFSESVFFCSDSDLRLILRLGGVVVQRHVRQCGIRLISYMYTNMLIEEGIGKYP